MKILTKEELLKKESLSVQELSVLSGKRYSTLKYFTEQGLLPYQQQGVRLARKYEPKSSLKRLEEIQKLKDKGKLIPELKDLLK